MITSLLLAYLSALALCLTPGFPGLLSQRPPAAAPEAWRVYLHAGSLQARLTEITRSADGKVGAALLLVETGDMLATLDADDQFPMQSVYKLPIAMAALLVTARPTERVDCPAEGWLRRPVAMGDTNSATRCGKRQRYP